MARPVRIHRGKQPVRFHYIPEWARHRHVSQADIARALRVDKSTVSRWFDGAVPVNAHLIALAGFLAAEEPAALFLHPDDDWITRFFKRRSEADRKRARAALELIFGEDSAA